MAGRRARKHGKRVAKIAYTPPVVPGWPLPDDRLAGAPELLSRVADALNECDRAGIIVRLAHGAVITDAGYVFRIAGPHEKPPVNDGMWAVRTRTLTEFPATSPDGDED